MARPGARRRPRSEAIRGLALMLLGAVWAGLAGAQEFATLKGHGGPIMGLAVNSEGVLASASFDNSVGLWSDGAPTWLEGHTAAVVAVLPLPGGRFVSGGDDFTVRLWEDGGGRILGRHEGKVAGLAATADGTLIASASWDGSIGLWPARGEARRLTGHDQGVNAVAFSADGTVLYSGASDGTIRSWDMATGRERAVLARHGFGINRLVVTETWLAYGAVDGGTRVLDLRSGERIGDFTLDRRPILALTHHPGTGQLAVGDGHGYIMVIDTAAWRITRDFRAARQGPVWALAFAPPGDVLYAGGIDDVIYAWPVALLGEFTPQMAAEPRPFLRAVDTMANGERQFMRKCSICHALGPGPSRKAGPTLHGLFGRRAGTVPGYSYSDVLDGSDIIWAATSIDALFDEGPDHYIPGSKMPMQVIAGAGDRADLVAFLRGATETAR